MQPINNTVDAESIINAIAEMRKAGGELRVEDTSKPLPEEALIQEQLRQLQQSYMRDAEPLLNRLHKLRCMRTPEYVIWMEKKSDQ